MKTKTQSKARPSKARNRKPVRSANVPVTAKMLYGVRDELIERMDVQFHSLKSEMHGFRSEMHGFKSEIHEIKSEIHEIKSEIHGVKADIHGVRADIHRLALLVEEQNARNVFVLDGLTGLFDRQDRLEKEMSRRS